MNMEWLEEQSRDLEYNAQVAVDKLEIQNLMGRYMYRHSLIMDGEIPELYATTVEVTRHDVGRGIYVGLEGIKRYHTSKRPRYRGKQIIHNQCNPIIEVAKDGQTAKGLWIAIDFECCPYMEYPDKNFDPMGPKLWGPDENGVMKYSDWVQHYIAADFIREHGQWKIWHYVYDEILRAPYKRDWIEEALTGYTGGLIMGAKRSLNPTEETPLSAPHDKPSPARVCGYDITSPPSCYAPIPQPYDTFENTFSY